MMTDEDVAFEDFHIAVIGSASVPGAFPPTPFKDHLFMDGMTAYNTDVQATIDRCRQITGNDDKLITIDIIQCSSPDNVKQMPHPSPSALTYVERAYALHSVYVGSDVVKAVQRAHPDINWRHHIHQTKKAEGTDELEFGPEVTHPLIEGGKSDAKKALDDMKMAEDFANAFATFLQ